MSSKHKDHKAYQKEYYAKNREAVKSRVRAHYRKNREAILAETKEYRVKNRVALAARRRVLYGPVEESRRRISDEELEALRVTHPRRYSQIISHRKRFADPEVKKRAQAYSAQYRKSLYSVAEKTWRRSQEYKEACRKLYSVPAYREHRRKLGVAYRTRPYVQEKGRLRATEYRQRNPEKSKASQAVYRKKNIDKLRAYRSKYNIKNADRIKKRQHEYRTSDEYRAKRRAAHNANPEKSRAAHREWRKKNIDHVHERDRVYRLKNIREVQV